MNALTCSLVFVSLGQTAGLEVEPERPATLQPPPVVSAAETHDQPRRLRVNDSPPTPLAEFETFPTQRYSAPELPPQPAAPARRSVVPANRTEPVVPVHADNSIDVANQILHDAIRSSNLRGKAKPLVSVLGAVDSTTRPQVLKNYWNLSVAIGRHAFAEHEALFLQRLPRPQSRTEDALLRAQIARSAARRSQARLDAVHWQERLAEYLPSREAGLPVPADVPFIGVYRTQIEKLYGQGQAPRRLNRIDRALPHELEIISRRAESIAAFESLVTELRDAYDAGAASVGQVLQASRELSLERTKFLDVVLSYNENIAEYSLSVVGPNAPAATLLSTLIYTDTAAQPTRLADANVRPAAAQAPASGDAGPTGFAAPSRRSPDAYRGVESEYGPDSRSALRP